MHRHDFRKQFVDEWGDVCDLADDKHPWHDFKPWKYWQNEFDWISCRNCLKEQDMIAWRDDVIKRNKSETRFINAARLVIGRICRLQDDMAFILVVFSEGREPLERESKIKRDIEWLSKYGVYRLPREAEHFSDPKPQEKAKAALGKKIHPKLATFISEGLALTDTPEKMSLSRNLSADRINP